jgi:hypothetical protein
LHDGVDVHAPHGGDHVSRRRAFDACRNPNELFAYAEGGDELGRARIERDDPLRRLRRNRRPIACAADGNGVFSRELADGFGPLAATHHESGGRDERTGEGSASHGESTIPASVTVFTSNGECARGFTGRKPLAF